MGRRARCARKIPFQISPKGTLIWIHAASVGEARIALALAAHLRKVSPSFGPFLLTTSTLSSAQLVTQAAGPEMFHQFAPLDLPLTVSFFLRRWRPTLVLFLESEIWPILLFHLRQQAIPTFLVNARLSSRSVARWKKLPRPMLQDLFSCFSQILARSARDLRFFRELGASSVVLAGDFKAMVSPLRVEKAALQKLRDVVAGRPLWIAASTHAGEEEMLLQVHQIVQKSYPSLLTFIAPRYIRRAAAIQKLCRQKSLSYGQRSQGKGPTSAQEIYIIDTLGELDLFYQLVDVVFVGGSFVPVGGHTLIEPAQFGCALLHGPYMDHHQDTADAFQRQGATRQVSHVEELATELNTLFADPAALAKRKMTVETAVTAQTTAPLEILKV
ncbi:MAG: 3-deoxy-D-manno-octulosonic acid transferase, partial [Holosporales bacterium]|nr:3-deoxy-D-manno-octulosonic acid transferase [Holosporales bacterium]